MNGRFEFVSPGNPGPILARAGEPPRTFDRPAVPIGMFEDSEYEDSVIRLEPGDRLYLHSDGLNEERNAAGEEFGRDRLLEQIESVGRLPFEEGVRVVAQTVRDWRGAHKCRDDVALLGVQYRG
jgi:sigma-B regulation protein RsbU (phosphoserine phosphatase)